MACPPRNFYLIGHGKMGKMIEQLSLEMGHTITPFIEDADVVIDFSHPDIALENIKKVSALKKPLVIGTTGWDENMEEAKKIIANNDGALLFSPNFSIGVYFFLKIVEKAASLLESFPEYGVRGIEMHHKEKIDAPSGTAKKMVSYFNKQIPITSVRTGVLPGKHTLLFDSFCDTITLTHDAQSRMGFAKGAIMASEWICGKKGWFTLDDVFGTLHSTCHTV